MITKAAIRNFRCLRDVTVAITPLTAFVGPNASGKTALLQGLVGPGRAVRPTDVWQHNPSATMEWEFSFDDGTQLQAKVDRNGNQQISRSLRSLLLRLDLDYLRQPNQVLPATGLVTDGSNLANVFDSLTRRQQEQVASELRRLVPAVADVDLRSTRKGHHELRFLDRWKQDLWYTPSQVSDGTILLVAFLTLQFMTPPVELLAIEEPERGLHPYLLEELVRFLRNLSAGKVGSKPIQVVLATHSAELLDVLRPEEVRFVARDFETGDVRVDAAPTGSPDWEQAFAEYRRSLGSAWLSGGLGGVPGA